MLTAYCKKCGNTHQRPVGKKCRHKKEGNDSHLTRSGTSNATTNANSQESTSVDNQTDIIAYLKRIETNQTQLINRVERLESSHIVSTSSPVKNDELSYHSHRSMTKPQDAQKKILKDFEEDGVNPSREFLRSAQEIQRQVTERLRSLDTASTAPNNDKDSNSAYQCLSRRARRQLLECYRPRTTLQYQRFFNEFIAFAVYLDIRRYAVTSPRPMRPGLCCMDLVPHATPRILIIVHCGHCCTKNTINNQITSRCTRDSSSLVMGLKNSYGP